STTNSSLFAVAPAVDASGKLTYTPAAGQAGTATVSVVLQVSGGGPSSTTESFTISVLAPLTAEPHSYLLSVGSANSATLPQGVVGTTQSDANGLPITAKLVTSPAFGAVTLNADGSFTYTEGPNFQGLDSFSYELTDGKVTSQAQTVQVTSYQATVITKLYQQVLHRPPDTAGLEYWVSKIQQGTSYGVVAQGFFESTEHLDPIIQQYYQTFLGRAADTQGLNNWYNVWVNHGGPEPVVAGMIDSTEFFALAAKEYPSSSSITSWVTGLYERLLGRAPQGNDLPYWTNQINSGKMTPTEVVNAFQSSQEYYQNLTISFFKEYLNRGPSSTELSAYVAAFQAGATQSDVQTQLINTPEYAETGLGIAAVNGDTVVLNGQATTPPTVGSVKQLS
ncbi:MAG: DUF4214 domain-containing protein, partial [Pirellulales bacterium]